MKRAWSGVVLLLVLASNAFGQTTGDGFMPLFNGQSLAGWHTSAKSGHSRASNHQSGGKWVIENGAIVGSQDIPGNGGLVLTDEPFGDFEVALEMNNDFGPDSGLFLRSTEVGKAWQAMVDYHANGNLMGVYGEGLEGKPNVLNFKFRSTPEEIEELVSPAGVPLPVLPSAWKNFWRHGQWNELRARIVGNPPHITTWINGVKFCDWREPELRHPATGSVGLQVHGGGDLTRQFVRYRNIRLKKLAPEHENSLTDAERQAGWLLLFDGKAPDHWMNSDGSVPQNAVEDGALNPHGSGHYMLTAKREFENFTLALDFKIAPRCNSGIFVRTSPLVPRPGKDPGYNGIEIAIDDSLTAGYFDTGAVYDLSKPTRNAMYPPGFWNHLEITCQGPRIEVVLNGENVNVVDLDKFTTANRRPDGTPHKFDVVYKDHPRKGYIGLQDHGGNCWYKNIKLLPLP